jgi:8-oxo-dGTP diphosphatase
MENRIVVAVKGIIVNNKKVLIIQRHDKDDIGAETWECVGGKLNFGEDLESALKREIKEETGIEVNIHKLLYATTFNTDPSRQVVIITYLSTSESDKVVLSEEHIAYKWATKEELKRLLDKGILNDFERNGIFLLEEIK